MGGARRKCEVCEIKEKDCSNKLLFAKFPLREHICKQWVKVVGKEDLVYLPIEKLHDLRYVCGNHFGKKDFTKSKTRLKKQAIPKLGLRLPPLPDELLEGFPLHMARSSKVHVPFAAVEVEVATTSSEAVVLSDPVSKSDQSGCDVRSTTTRGIERKLSDSTLVHTPLKVVQGSTCQVSFAAVQVEVATTSNEAVVLSDPVPISDQSGDILPTTTREVKRKLSALTSPKKIRLTHVPGSPKGMSTQKKMMEENTVHTPLKVVQASTCQAPFAAVNVEVATTSNEAAVLSDPAPISNQSGDILPTTSRGVKRKSSALTSPKKIRLTHVPGSPKGMSTQKKMMEETTDLTPRKKKLVEDLRKTRLTLRSLRKSALLIEKIKSPVLKEIVINAAKNQSRHSKGRRWTMKNKISALAILKRSAKTYRYLNQVLPLPSEKTLHNMLKKVPMQPGVNKSVLNHLKKIAPKKNDKDKVCCLLFDEMAIKPRLILNPSNDTIEGYEDLGQLGRKGEVADHALVFMLQGLHHKYKQPIAFYFTKGTISSPNLANIIKNIITEVSATGFHILNTVCDQGPTNMGALKLLREGSGCLDGANHYFVHNNQKVFIVFDVPHLFKSLRNNFLNQGSIKICGKKGEWSHLLEVEKENSNFLYLSKISEAHVNPKYKTKMRVKYAAQILSTTVSAVLKLLSRAETNMSKKQGFMQTAEVIQELDLLFDLTNGPSGPNDKKKDRRENVSKKTNHLNAWGDWIKKIETIEFINKNGKTARNVKCVQGYKTTLKSLRDIWQYVSKMGFKYLNLRQLNQDSLENLFGLIRQQSPTNKNPTAAHFISALKAAIITRMTAPQIKGSNCEKDQNFLLTGFENAFNEDKENVEPREDRAEQKFTVKETLQEDEDEEMNVLSLPDFHEEPDQFEAELLNLPGQAVVYVSGYLASRLLKNNSCPKCKLCLSLEKPPQMQNSIYDYIKFREWWNDKVSLTYPTLNLCKVVQIATNVMENEIVNFLHERNIIQLAMTIFQVHFDLRWFSCKTHEKPVINLLCKKLALLLVRRACQKINIKYASQEETVADACKKAQQLGKAK